MSTNHRTSTEDQRVAVEVARSLQSQLFFYKVESDDGAFGAEDVYTFLGDEAGGSGAPMQTEELPTGVVTYLTKCYTPRCVDGSPCYACLCPRRVGTLESGGAIILLRRFYQVQSGLLLSTSPAEALAPRVVYAFYSLALGKRWISFLLPEYQVARGAPTKNPYASL